MVFSSMVFLWLFLPITFLINLFLRDIPISNFFLVLASLFFYAWGEPIMVLLMLVSILVNYLLGIGIGKLPKYRKIFLILGVVYNIGILVYYKYTPFIIKSVNDVAGRTLFTVPNIIMPIGISFFTFQALSYVIDVYRGDTKAQPSPMSTALYISFFPQLIAGPIVKYREINEQIESRKITFDKFSSGFRRFIYGLGKKVLISNVLGLCADNIYNMEPQVMDCGMAWAAALCYTFQIYYDFSGYSDMAIGLGAMFGFDIPENFKYPYLSKSIGEFWRRWHISLGTWFREYLYIPLGGNRKGKGRTYFNLIIVFFLTGVWHGAGFNFIFWGMYHGLFSVLERLGLKKILDKCKPLGLIYCFLVVNFGWVFFRISSLKKGFEIIGRMLMPWKTAAAMNFRRYVDNRTLIMGVCAVLGAGIIQTVIPDKIKNKWRGSILEAIYCCVLMVLSIASIATDTYNPFIYFQF